MDFVIYICLFICFLSICKKIITKLLQQILIIGYLGILDS